MGWFGLARSSYTKEVTSDDSDHSVMISTPHSGATPAARRPIARRLPAAAAAATLVVALLAGCGGDNSQTDCDLNSCTVTFDRGVDASVSVLGIEAKLVTVQNSQATIEVAGQQVTVPVGENAEADGWNVAVQSITADNVVIKISAA